MKWGLDLYFPPGGERPVHMEDVIVGCSCTEVKGIPGAFPFVRFLFYPPLHEYHSLLLSPIFGAESYQSVFQLLQCLSCRLPECLA